MISNTEKWLAPHVRNQTGADAFADIMAAIMPPMLAGSNFGTWNANLPEGSGTWQNEIIKHAQYALTILATF